jgi:cyclopropane-fatty-acyl-phospholipid synthase
VWPGLFDIPKAPVHAAIAQKLAKAAIKNLPITLAFPDGTTWGAGGPRLELVRPDNFFARLGADGLIGFGEAWMTGDMTTGGWHATGASAPHLRVPDLSLDAGLANAATDELAAVLGVLCRRMSVLVPRPLQTLRHAWQSRPPRRTPRPGLGRTSIATMTCPTTSSSSFLTRR